MTSNVIPFRSDFNPSFNSVPVSNKTEDNITFEKKLSPQVVSALNFISAYQGDTIGLGRGYPLSYRLGHAIIMYSALIGTDFDKRKSFWWKNNDYNDFFEIGMNIFAVNFLRGVNAKLGEKEGNLQTLVNLDLILDNYIDFFLYCYNHNLIITGILDKDSALRNSMQRQDEKLTEILRKSKFKSINAINPASHITTWDIETE